MAALLWTLAPMAPAAAKEPGAQPSSESASTRYQVTFAARSCGSYAEVMANRVRDDQIEAASAPGRASAYKDGQAVDPDVEAANASGCGALSDWRFGLGSGQRKEGPLSTVTTMIGEAGPTTTEVPRLDATGRPTGAKLGGAVTVTLTDEQVRLAVRRQLWVQGGTPEDPLLAKARPGFGFGALRCAVDGRAGTNTQWIGFPAGVRHVFCFAYYVRSATPPATLVVRARSSRPVGYPQRFGFDASPSYTAAKRVESTGEFSFVRTSGGAPSVIVAHPPAGWRVADLGCNKTGAGASSVQADPIAGRVAATLVAGEVVTCTYTFEPPPAPDGLTLRLFSDVPGGAFGLTVNGEGGPRTLRATPTGDGSAAAATGADLSTVLPGPYTVTLAPPAAEAALWSLAGVGCGGTELKPEGLTVTVAVAGTAPVDCALRVVRKAGGIELRAVTVGAPGMVSFAVVPRDTGSGGWSAVADATAAGTPAVAEGDVPASLPFRTYLVTPLAPRSTVDGSWRLTSFECDPGESVTVPNPGADLVPLSTATAEGRCTASFLFQPAAHLQVTLRFEGHADGRVGDTALDVSCADGSTGRVVLPMNDYGESSLPQPLGFVEPTRCTVGRVETGVADDASATWTAALDPAPGNAPLSLPGTVEVAGDPKQYAVLVTVKFTSAHEAPRKEKVLDTFRVLPVALIGAGLVGIGLVILLVMVVRSRGV